MEFQNKISLTSSNVKLQLFTLIELHLKLFDQTIVRLCVFRLVEISHFNLFIYLSYGNNL